MASGMYTYGISQIMRGNIDLINDDISAVLVSSSYSPTLSTDQNQDDIPEAAVLGETSLDGNAISGTAFTANSCTIEAPDSGETANAVVIINNSGDTATSQLIAYLQVTSITTDGTDVVIDFDADGIFEL